MEEEEVGVGRCMVEEEVEVDEEGGGREAWCGGKCGGVRWRRKR